MIDMIFNLQQRLPPHRRLQLAFPDSHHPPAQLLQFLLVPFITLPVAFNLLAPKLTVGMGNMTVQLVPMPKTPVYENHDAILAQYDVRRARQRLHVLAVTVAAREKVTAHNPLRFRVLAPYLRHDGRTLLLAPNIHSIADLSGCKNNHFLQHPRPYLPTIHRFR